MRSKVESKYRTKIIQELHLKKLNQIWLDNYCENISYKDFYLSGLKPPLINNVYQAINDIAKESKKLLYCVSKQVTKAMNDFTQAIYKFKR